MSDPDVDDMTALLTEARAAHAADLESVAGMDDDQLRYLTDDTLYPEDEFDCETDVETVDADSDAPQRGEN